MENKTNGFIIKSKKIHGDTYNYSLVIIENAKSKIKIQCLKHGIFEQRADHHLNGSGCPKCVNHNMTSSELIEKYKLVHGNKYDYSLVKYKNAKTNITIICHKHGIFELGSRHHLAGVNCSKCERERISYNQRKTTTEFIESAKKRHGDKYDYSLVNYTKAVNPVEIICYDHGAFKQIPRNHISGGGCPVCRESKGEQKIRRYLETKKINFIPQYKFNNCRNKRPLPFDFYLPEYNICIEFNGQQHYMNLRNGFGRGLEYIKANDKIKLDYCLNNKINICIIPYYDINKIDSLLDFYLRI